MTAKPRPLQRPVPILGRPRSRKAKATPLGATEGRPPHRCCSAGEPWQTTAMMRPVGARLAAAMVWRCGRPHVAPRQKAKNSQFQGYSQRIRCPNKPDHPTPSSVANDPRPFPLGCIAGKPAIPLPIQSAAFLGRSKRWSRLRDLQPAGEGPISGAPDRGLPPVRASLGNLKTPTTT